MLCNLLTYQVSSSTKTHSPNGFCTNWQPVVLELEVCFDGCLGWNMRGLKGASHGGEYEASVGKWV